jgi:DUF971 family protein
MRIQSFQVVDDGRTLIVAWAAGGESRLAASQLWAECRSAGARRRRLDGCDINPPSALAIVAVSPVGRYGISIAFSDGNDRGIYPWSMLAGLGRRPTVDDFLMPAPTDAP